MTPSNDLLDCAIIGGGPAGLSAAIYLARFRRSVQLIDAGNSRASWIPLSRNYPGFPEGISGPDLLDCLREQAASFGVTVQSATVQRLEKSDDGVFSIYLDNAVLRSTMVMLATGLQDIEPAMPQIRQALARGQVRYCPVCDGYETAGKTVAVIGHGSSCIREAAFIRHFTDDLTVLRSGADPAMPLSHGDRTLLQEKNIRLIDEPIADIALDGDTVTVRMHGGMVHRFDTVYAMLGTKVRSELALALGARCDDSGNLLVDPHLQTSVPGLYAAGDVVSGLDQISVATGHAAIASTAMHRRLWLSSLHINS